MIHQHCSELMLSVFIECVCDANYKGLIKEGEHSQAELEAAWMKLYDEYLDITSKMGDNNVLQLLNEYDEIFFRHTVIEKCVELLSWWHDDRLVEILREKGFTYKFDHTDTEQYLKDLKRVLSRSKKNLLDIEVRRKQLEAIQKANEGVSIDRNYFDTILVALSKFAQYHVNEYETTVGRYIALLNMYTTYCRQLTAKGNVGSDR